MYEVNTIHPKKTYPSCPSLPHLIGYLNKQDTRKPACCILIVWIDALKMEDSLKDSKKHVSYIVIVGYAYVRIWAPQNAKL